MKDERYKKIMDDLGMPNSRSLLVALQQVANEAGQECAAAEREACALAVMDRGRNTKNGEWHGNNHAAEAFAECIRERSNAPVHAPA